MKKKEQIKHIINEFDYNKIHSVMKFLNWEWKYEKNIKKIPNIADLKSISEFCLNKVANSIDENAIFSIGGFEAEKINNTLELRFILDRVNPLRHMLNSENKSIMKIS